MFTPPHKNVGDFTAQTPVQRWSRSKVCPRILTLCIGQLPGANPRPAPPLLQSKVTNVFVQGSIMSKCFSWDLTDGCQTSIQHQGRTGRPTSVSSAVEARWVKTANGSPLLTANGSPLLFPSIPPVDHPRRDTQEAARCHSRRRFDPRDPGSKHRIGSTSARHV